MAVKIVGKVDGKELTLNTVGQSQHQNMDRQGNIEGPVMAGDLHFECELNQSKVLFEAMDKQTQKAFKFEVEVLDETGKVEHKYVYEEAKFTHLDERIINGHGATIAGSVHAGKYTRDNIVVYDTTQVWV